METMLPLVGNTVSNGRKYYFCWLEVLFLMVKSITFVAENKDCFNGRQRLG
jgi:hypothetical protein